MNRKPDTDPIAALIEKLEIGDKMLIGQSLQRMRYIIEWYVCPEKKFKLKNYHGQCQIKRIR